MKLARNWPILPKLSSACRSVGAS